MARTSKPPVPAHEFTIACTINCFFTVLSLVDYSADTWALAVADTLPDATSHAAWPAEIKDRLVFLSKFYSWRGEAPIVSTLMLVLLVPLPFVIFGMLFAAAQSLLGLRTASRLRHVADVVQPCTLLGLILPTVIYHVIGAEGSLKENCSATTFGGSAKRSAEFLCLESAISASLAHRKMLVLNLVMFACDVAKYVGNVPPSSAAAEEKKDK